jgi:hypothetical protein
MYQCGHDFDIFLDMQCLFSVPCILYKGKVVLLLNMTEDIHTIDTLPKPFTIMIVSNENYHYEVFTVSPPIPLPPYQNSLIFIEPSLCTRHCSKLFANIISILTSIQPGRYHYYHPFTEEETKA